MKTFIFYILFFLAIQIPGLSQDSPSEEQPSSVAVEMADSLREEGKIYVVVLVVAILFTFFLGYLVVADRQLKKVEKELEDLRDSNNK